MRVSLRNPFVLAPVAGVTDSVFRKICFEQGSGFAFTEMVSAKALCYDDKRTKELLRTYPGESGVGVQLFGSEPHILAEAARRVEGMGFSAIDINMGCPAKKITSNGEGGALMKDRSRSAKLVSETVKAVRLPVSVKFRLGWEKNDAVAFAKAMEDAGASMAAVHGRTVLQQYTGRADWDAIAYVARMLSVPVVGNGDLRDARIANERLCASGCAAVMIARGALGNPWLFAECESFRNGGKKPPPTGSERIEMAKRHAADAAAYYGEKRAALIMRKHCAWYIKGLKNAAAVRERLNSCLKIGEMLDVLENYRLELEEN